MPKLGATDSIRSLLTTQSGDLTGMVLPPLIELLPRRQPRKSMFISTGVEVGTRIGSLLGPKEGGDGTNTSGPTTIRLAKPKACAREVAPLSIKLRKSPRSTTTRGTFTRL